MQSPIKNRSIIDITRSASQNKAILQDLLSAHALPGCDTVECYFAIGKGSALKVMHNGQCPLTAIGNPGAPFELVLEQFLPLAMVKVTVKP